jgi:hypothetical protein
MVTMTEECTTEEQSFVMRFCGPKDSMQRIFIKKYFLFTVGSVCRVKWFTAGWQASHDEQVESEMRKWLRQQSEDFYTSGFDALVKRWNKYISVGGGYVEK